MTQIEMERMQLDQLTERIIGIAINIHPPTQDTTGLPVEECESDNRSCFGAMFALFWKGRMNCFEAPTRKRWSEEESITGTTALAVGLHFFNLNPIQPCVLPLLPSDGNS